MHPSTSILICGNDPMLLETRRWLLERAGYRVAPVKGDVVEVARLTAAEPVKILVLCHSLTLDQMRQAMAAALTRKPEIAVLALSKLIDVGPAPISGARAVSTARPADLLEAVARVEAESPPMSLPPGPIKGAAHA